MNNKTTIDVHIDGIEIIEKLLDKIDKLEERVKFLELQKLEKYEYPFIPSIPTIWIDPNYWPYEEKITWTCECGDPGDCSGKH